VCACIRAYTLTDCLGTLCEPRCGMDTWRAGRIQIDWSAVYMQTVSVYKVYLSIYMLGSGFSRSGLAAFFLLTYLFFWEMYKIWRQTANFSHSLRWEYQVNRLHLKSSKRNCYNISLWAIIKAIFIQEPLSSTTKVLLNFVCTYIRLSGVALCVHY